MQETMTDTKRKDWTEDRWRGRLSQAMPGVSGRRGFRDARIGTSERMAWRNVRTNGT